MARLLEREVNHVPLSYCSLNEISGIKEQRMFSQTDYQYASLVSIISW